MKSAKYSIFQVIFIVLILVACCAASGCRSVRYVCEVVNDTVEHTVVEYVRDTIRIEVPAQEKEQTVRDSASHLETDYAQSDARINPDGTLYHSLANKAGERELEGNTKVLTKTRTIRNTKTVTREKELSLWQKMCIRFFPWTVLVLLGLLVWTMRKPLIAWLLRKPP